MQTVAIIDYGSGNLHSAGKAFERAARESGTRWTTPCIRKAGRFLASASVCS
jgi:imidazole glycerol-phosphate synthase subunit HisH